MSEMPLSADPQAYLENLMRAGQDAMKRYDDALASAAGVQTAEYLSSGRPPFPFALIADLQRDYLKQIWRRRLWNAMFLQSGRMPLDFA
jgi:polyhydroxyalkanoate synthase